MCSIAPHPSPEDKQAFPLFLSLCTPSLATEPPLFLLRLGNTPVLLLAWLIPSSGTVFCYLLMAFLPQGPALRSPSPPSPPSPACLSHTWHPPWSLTPQIPHYALILVSIALTYSQHAIASPCMSLACGWLPCLSLPLPSL